MNGRRRMTPFGKPRDAACFRFRRVDGVRGVFMSTGVRGVVGAAADAAPVPRVV